MVSDEETNDTNKDTLQQKLICLEQKYNQVRHELFNKMRNYYKQSIASKYITEDDLLDLINQCVEIKNEYFELQSNIMNKRTKIPWSFRSSFKFSSQVSQEESYHGNY